MAFSSDPTQRTTGERAPLGHDLDAGWSEPDKPAFDWKKRALVIGLGLLSWVATYVGMLELIEANMGELPIIHKLIIGFSVAMLMTMVVWLLDEMFKPNPFFTKVLYAGGYLFLTIISVGFGFGFYWKVLESRSEASRSAEGAVTQVQGSLVAASTRLDQLTATLDQLTAVSTQKAQVEKASGTSCPNSKPGDGPRRKLREDDAARFTFAGDFVKGRATTVKTEMAGLDVDLAKISSDDKSIVDAKSGTRNAFMQGLSRKLDNTVTGFNAFRTDPQLKQIRTDLAERAEKTTFPDTAGKIYSCPDAQLQTALRGVVRAIDQLPELEKPKIAAVEGSEATIEAFRRLTASFYGLLSFKMPPSADELRDMQKKAIQSVEATSASTKSALNEQPGLSKRDYVPLAIAIFVDICLLLVSMGKSHDRLAGLVPKMRAAERGPVIQILSRFNDIHRDRQIRENFELFRHVVFDFHGDYYVAVPMDAPRKMNPREREELRLETQLLSNLFASFEKEKIFTRVYSPFLTPGAVRKRLARQGSKFDRSDAFRLYRFKDGAWSDIILGAVMGAARRVEAEKRVLTARADEADRTAAAALAAATASGGVGPQPSANTLPGWTPQSEWAPQWPTARDARTQDTKMRPSGAQPMPTDYQTRFGDYAPYAANEASHKAPTAIPAATGFDASSYGDNVHPLPQRVWEPIPQRGAHNPPTNEAPYQERYQLPYPTAQSQVPSSGFAPQPLPDPLPANSNTAPVRPPQAEPILPAAHVVPFSPTPVAKPYSPSPVNTSLAMAEPVQAFAPQPGVVPALSQIEAWPPQPTHAVAPDWQNQIGLVMTRVTESISVPVSSQARLPEALMGMGLRPAAATPNLSDQAAILLAQPEGRHSSEREDWSPADAALIRKYASQAGE